MTTGAERKRPDITMSHDEMAAFLATQSHAVVVAVDGGAPVGTVADLGFNDGELVVTMRAGDTVTELLRSDDRVCVIAEQFPQYYEIKGVAAHGRAVLTQSSDGRPRFSLGLDDTTSFDFGKLPREGSGKQPG